MVLLIHDLVDKNSHQSDKRERRAFVTTETKTESSVEVIKRASNFLRGDLASDLLTDEPNVSNDSEQSCSSSTASTRRISATCVASARWLVKRSTTFS